MKKGPKDWHLQLVWFIAGVFATGALWYFISANRYVLALSSGILAIIFAIVAVFLHKARDKADEGTSTSRKDRLHDEIRLTVGEELVTFTEMERTKDFDIIKVNTNNHFLGVASEYRWIEYRYPDTTRICQAITTLDRLQKVGSDKPEKEKIFFDVIDIEFPEGRQKKIYFDISRFFTLDIGTPLDPNAKAAERLKDLYG